MSADHNTVLEIEKRHPWNFMDLSGKRFGRLLVLEHAGRSSKDQATLWRCKCDCGTSRIVRSQPLRLGYTVSCGCRRKEIMNILGGARFTKHGHAKRGVKAGSAYSSWNAMRTRCRCKGAPNYRDYGGRGIKIDPTWDSFEKFLSEMGERPSGTSLDRIDPDGHYTAENCRWATPRQQRRNQRRIRIDTFSDDELLAEIRRRGLSI
jgi:hypothetical protein